MSRLDYIYYTYNSRVHLSLKGKSPFEVYLRRPNFSLFIPQCRHDLTSEESEYLSSAYLDVDEVDHDTEEVGVVDSDDVGGVPDQDVGGDNCHGSEASGDEDATEHDNGLVEDYPLEMQPIRPPDYEVGTSVWLHHAANLGGAAGTAALQPQWQEGEVCGHVYQEGNFLLYEVMSAEGDKSSLASALVKPRALRIAQWDEPMPSEWASGPTPYTGQRKRRKRRR